jgi:type II secretory pathway pseudopilin PulG
MNNSNKLGRTKQVRSRGFSTLELLIVMMISLVIAALAIPGFNQMRRALRISGDARDLNGAINQAKLQAASDFTWTRVYIDLGANAINTFHVEAWNKAGLGGAGCWQTVGDVNNPCTVVGVSPVQSLSSGVSFGTSGVGAPPPNAQPNGIGQAIRCVPVNGRRVGQLATTACITLNSRGVPIDPATATPTANDAVYITDNTQVYAVTVSPTGLSQVWATGANNGNATWYHK